jgi:hypothetical protein
VQYSFLVRCNIFDKLLNLLNEISHTVNKIIPDGSIFAGGGYDRRFPIAV